MSQLGLWVGFVGAVVYVSRANGTGSLTADYGLSWPHPKDVGLGLAGAVVGRFLPLIVLITIVVAGRGFGTPSGASPEILGTTPSGTAAWVVVVSLAVVGAPIIEELFFRGLLQGEFTRRVGPVPALFITALIFSFSHVINEGPFAPIASFRWPSFWVTCASGPDAWPRAWWRTASSNTSPLRRFLIPAFR